MGAMGLFVSFGAYVNVQFNNHLFETRGLSPAQIGMVAALGCLPALFSPVVAGWWTDRSGSPRFVLSVYMLLGGVGLALLPHLRGFPMLALGFFLAQVAISPISPLSQSLVLRRTGTGNSAFFALRAMGTLGFFLVSLWLSHRLRFDGLDVAYLAMGAFLLASLPFFLALPAGSDTLGGTSDLKLREVVSSLWDRRLWAVYFGGGLGFLCNAMGVTILANLVTGPFGRGPEDISRAWAIATGFELAFMFLAIPFVGKFGLKSLLVTGFVATSVRWLLAGFATDFSMLLAAQSLHGLMVVGVFTGQSLVLARLLPPERISSGTTAAALLNGGVMSIAGSMLSGWVWELWGVRAVCFLTAAVAFAAGAFYLLLGPTPEHRRRG